MRIGNNRHSGGRFFSERGDTIVEVLISIAVVSLVIGGAYVTTNRSLLATRAAQERSNALKLAETQIELLKGLAKTNPEVIFGGGSQPAPNPFCIAGTNSVVDASDAACTVDVSGAPTSEDPAFTVSVNRGPDNNTFAVDVDWTNISGDITDELRLIYRVYE